MNKYHLVGYFHGKAVYAPDRLAANRSLSIEKDHNALHAMTAEEIVEWKAAQYDLALTQRLEEEREWAEQVADAWFAEECEAEREATLRNGSGVF